MDASAKLAEQLATRVIQRAQAGGLAVSAEVKRASLLAARKLLKAHPTPTPGQFLAAFLREFRIILRRYEPILITTLSDARLAAWMQGGYGVVEEVPRDDLPGFEAPIREREQNAIVQFPIIQKAAEDLAKRRILAAEEFYRQEAIARVEAFTVSNIASLDALEKVRDGLIDVVLKGRDLQAFQETVERTLGKSRLADYHVENVFRSNVLTAYARGQKAVLEHPQVKDYLPFVVRSEIRDSRLTDLCDVLSHSGLEGTRLYWVGDPVWKNIAGTPSHFQCRCTAIFITVERAATRYGLKVAQKWLKSGVRPRYAELCVSAPSVKVPVGWVSPWVSGPIVLSGFDPNEPRNEKGEWTAGGAGGTSGDMKKKLTAAEKKKIQEEIKTERNLMRYFAPGSKNWTEHKDKADGLEKQLKERSSQSVAKKFKVKNTGRVVFHGTGRDFDKPDVGSYWSSNKDAAQVYLYGQEGFIHKGRLHQNAKVKDIGTASWRDEDVREFLDKRAEDHTSYPHFVDLVESRHFREFLVSRGYDAVEFEEVSSEPGSTSSVYHNSIVPLVPGAVTWESREHGKGRADAADQEGS